MSTCIYPGSFDPVTLGHLDIVNRALKMFDRVIVVVLHNPAKKGGSFSIEDRVKLLQAAFEGMEGVEVDSYGGMTSDYAMKVGADAIIRGLRGMSDWESERTLAQWNRRLANIETLFLASNPLDELISSSAVRELMAFGGPWQEYVPEATIPLIEQMLQKR